MTDYTVSPGGNLQDADTGDVLYVHGGMVYEPGLSAYETRRIAGQIPLERFDNDDPVAVLYRHVSRVIGRDRGARSSTRDNHMNPRGEVELVHPVTKMAVTIPVSVEAMRDIDGVRTFITKAVDDSFDRYLHPWKYPDRPAWPEFVPVPGLAAFVDRMRERRQRVRDAWLVLLGRERIYDEDTDSDW